MPVGCHFTQKLSDQPTQGGGSEFFREIYITFGAWFWVQWPCFTCVFRVEYYV